MRSNQASENQRGGLEASGDTRHCRYFLSLQRRRNRRPGPEGGGCSRHPVPCMSFPQCVLPILLAAIPLGRQSASCQSPLSCFRTAQRYWLRVGQSFPPRSFGHFWEGAEEATLFLNPVKMLPFIRDNDSTGSWQARGGVSSLTLLSAPPTPCNSMSTCQPPQNVGALLGFIVPNCTCVIVTMHVFTS